MINECAHGLREECSLPDFSWRSRGKFIVYTDLTLAACGANHPHSGCDHNKQAGFPGQAVAVHFSRRHQLQLFVLPAAFRPRGARSVVPERAPVR